MKASTSRVPAAAAQPGPGKRQGPSDRPLPEGPYQRTVPSASVLTAKSASAVRYRVASSLQSRRGAESAASRTPENQPPAPSGKRPVTA